LLKYTPKEKRKVGQKALTPIKEIVNSLVTSYTFPLQRIDQSMPIENLVIRTSVGNKRVVLRGNSSNPLMEAPSLGAPSPGGPSPFQRRWKKDNKRRFVEANKQINISHEGEGSFQGDTFEIFRYDMMGEFSRHML